MQHPDLRFVALSTPSLKICTYAAFPMNRL